MPQSSTSPAVAPGSPARSLPGMARPGAVPPVGPPVPRQRPQRFPPLAGAPAQSIGAPHARPVPAPEPTQVAAPVPPPVADGHDGAWALVKAAQNGDMAAFGELFDRYFDMVFRFALVRMNGDRAQAEDIASETFVRALRRITSVTYQGRDIGAWFVTIARNLIFDHVKSSRYRLEHATDEIVEHSPSTHGPEQQVLDGATNDELLRCVRKLNPDQQECITLRFLQGLSVAETAVLMDRNEGAVKALQHRAVRRLAQLLPEGIR
jgi:RNA polymerase sigma-70 factor (ECF subfamily)